MPKSLVTSMPVKEEVVSVSVPQSNFPVPESHNSLEVVEVSQSPNRPPSLSGRVKAEIEAVPETSKLVATEAVVSKKALASTSRSPEIKRSSAVERPRPVVVVPNRE